MRIFRRAGLAAVWVAQLLLAAFFLFVGYMKTFATMADLATYHAWVAGLPPLIARAVGWSEMFCAVMLILPAALKGRRHWIARSAIVLLANQIVAVGFHAWRGDLAGSWIQNLVLIILLAAVALAWRWRKIPTDASGRRDLRQQIK